MHTNERGLERDRFAREMVQSFPTGAAPLTVTDDTVPSEENRLGSEAKRAVHKPPTVLLAEDNDDLRQVMEWLLEGMGYAVVSCPDGQLALAAFRSRADIDLLLTDFEMPGKTGVELAREVTALRASLPVMIVSGSVISPDLTQEMGERKWGFLPKPFAIPALRNNLDFLLQQNELLAVW